jgi:hypothetical protein
MTIKHFTIIASLLILPLSILSCATGNQPVSSSSGDIEMLLLEAGFLRKPIDSPEKMERARAEVQRKVIPYQGLEGIYYIYVDVDLCQCVYTGNESAFSRFEELVYLKNVERNRYIDNRLRSIQDEPWRD